MDLQDAFRFKMAALSVLIAILAAYTAFGFNDVLVTASGRRRRLWLIAGASCMGFGIWTMHYLGVLAFYLPIPVFYRPPMILISLACAAIASCAILFSVTQQPHSPRQLAIGTV